MTLIIEDDPDLLAALISDELLKAIRGGEVIKVSRAALA